MPILSLISVIVFVFIGYHLLGKILSILNNTDYGYYINTLLIIVLIWVNAFIVYNKIINNKETEILVCNKETNNCIYKTNSYKNNEFKEEARFILSDIKSIKMNAFELPSGKRNRIKQHFIITLFFYNNKKLTYPIQSTSHDDLKQRYEKFASYLEDNKINEYEDIKKNNISEMILLIITCNIIMTLIVLIINIRKRNRMKNSL